ncbi:hypothetical protein ACIQF6_02760 [Kitasatospora sp. NPDC092948]|uniref:hypothetical protein n=1 Tax=Kitasatospora sp. NPDC092948 TaxID=3364088 RepID=UPI00380EEFD8
MTKSVLARSARGTALFGCGVLACLGIVVVLGWGLLRLVDGSGPQPADAAGFDRYLDVTTAWAVGAALTGLVGAGLAPLRGGHSSLAWLARCDLAMLLAFLWPLQALLVALSFALKARERAQWQRVGAALAGAALLTTGVTWGLACYRAEQRWAPPAPSDRALVGTWTGVDGRVLELRPDGQYRTNFIGEDPNRIWSSRPPAYLSGHWTLKETSDNGRGQSIVLNDSTTMDVYGASSPSMLCEPVEYYGRCYLSMQRK